MNRDCYIIKINNKNYIYIIVQFKIFKWLNIRVFFLWIFLVKKLWLIIFKWEFSDFYQEESLVFFMNKKMY